MNRFLRINIILVSALSLSAVLCNADDNKTFIDDVYYSEITALEDQLSQSSLLPYYNKKAMQELIFQPDTIVENVSERSIDSRIESELVSIAVDSIR